MTALDMLMEVAERGHLTHENAVRAEWFTGEFLAGQHRGATCTLVLTVMVYRDGVIRAKAEFWADGALVPRPSPEMNWPLVKAVRELERDPHSAVAVERLLSSSQLSLGSVVL